MTENSTPSEDMPAEAGDSFKTADGQADSSDVVNDVARTAESDDYLIVGQVLEEVISSPDLCSASPTTTTQIVDEMQPSNGDQQQAQEEMMDVEEDKEALQEEEQKSKAQSDDHVEDKEIQDEDVREADGKDVDEKEVKDMGVDEKEVEDMGVDEKEVEDMGVDEKGVDEKEVDEKEVNEEEVNEEEVNEEGVGEKEENGNDGGDNEMQEIEMTPEDEPPFTIERIVDKKTNSEGKPLWLVKWKDYSSKDNTWEPLEHLVECDKTVQEFEMARARMVAERYDEEKAKNANGQGPNQTGPRRKPMMPRHRDYEILDVMGITKVNGEKYFLVTIANSTKKGFIRESIANRVIPSKVIDFYIKNLQWKAVSSPEAKYL